MCFFFIICLWDYFRFYKGDVFIIVLIGMMIEVEGEKWGLVFIYVYVVLDIREFKVLF